MKKKKTIGLLTPANEFPSEYVKFFEKLGVNYKIITNSSIYDEYTGLLCVGEKKFSKEEKIFDYLQNADKTNIPISTGEQLYNRWEFQRLFEQKAISIVQPDICHAG